MSVHGLRGVSKLAERVWARAFRWRAAGWTSWVLRGGIPVVGAGEAVGGPGFFVPVGVVDLVLGEASGVAEVAAADLSAANLSAANR